MRDANQKTKGLVYYRIDVKNSALIDPDNIFWIITRDDKRLQHFITRKSLVLYSRWQNKLDAELKDFRFSSNLTAVYIDPTDRCNSQCPYCYIPQDVRSNGQSMTKEELDFILEKIAKYFNRHKRKSVIVFHASEPLLVKEVIFEAIEKFKSEFKFGLQTNAILLERKDVEFLKRHRVGVGISLDSYLPYVNNRLRPTAQIGGNFQQAVRAIEWFNGYEGLNVITTVTKLNVSQLSGMVEFLHRKKVPCVLFNPVRLTQNLSHRLKPKEGLLTKHFIKAVNTAIELSKESGHKIIIGNFTNIILGIVAPTARRLMCDISPCGGGRCFLTITAKGDMVPCGEFIGLKGFRGGNIFKTSIKEALQSESFQRIRSRIAEKIPKCNSCIFRNICGAPCPAELFALGNMYQPAIFCEFYKKIISYAFELIAQGQEKYCFRKSARENLQYEYKLS